VQAERHAGQLRAQAIVKVAPKPPTLFLARRDEPRPGVLQVSGQPHGVHRNPGLACQILEQTPVRGAERLTTSPLPEHQLTHAFQLVNEW